MVDATHISFAASDRSYFSLLKKEIHRRAEEAGMGIDKLNALDLVIAEMTSNLFKYGDGGEILMGLIENNGNPYVEVISIDHGPGMLNPEKMLIDGVSTTNTLGHGLGSIQRLSDTFDLYSQPEWGTIVLSRIYHNAKVNEKKIVEVHPLVVAKPGEKTSGDGFLCIQTDKYLKMMLADGLGHGPEANHAVNEAATAFRTCRDYSPVETMRYIHPAIKKTRGAVINITCFDYRTKIWSSAGIGNIAARIMGPVVLKNHMSYNGIVGHNIPGSMNDQQYAGAEYNRVILSSDGIKTRWDLNKYPRIHKHDQTILAAAIYKDQARKTDDMSIIIAKIK